MGVSFPPRGRGLSRRKHIEVERGVLEAMLEEWISQLAEDDGGASLDRAREAFHERTGPFEVGEPWYEERLTFFFDWFLSEGGGARSWLDRHPDADEQARLVARAYMTSARSLYTVGASEGGVVQLLDRLGGGLFSIEAAGQAERLIPGETFDGRLLVTDRAHLARGIIFHPPETQEALEALLLAITPIDGDRAPVLNGLLRMKMRLDRFTSIRPRHIYAVEALEERSINSAGWARKPV